MVLTICSFDKIGEQIRKVRKARGLNQTQLAEKVGITLVTMSKIENGADLNTKTIRAICNVLECQINFVFTVDVNDLNRLMQLAESE